MELFQLKLFVINVMVQHKHILVIMMTLQYFVKRLTVKIKTVIHLINMEIVILLIMLVTVLIEIT